ncbi:MAG: DUF3300 domain-containing protein, partial [Alphaproteobacteria bacterium]|nr:DUF3300 domain-containing protein [Alphaproteobacteria bacterium]
MFLPCAAGAQTVEAYPPGRLERIVAPVALYPDPLLGEILQASTSPLQIVEAARWRQDPAHAGLSDAALADALQAENWQPSVRALISAPQILNDM